MFSGTIWEETKFTPEQIDQISQTYQISREDLEELRQKEVESEED